MDIWTNVKTSSRDYLPNLFSNICSALYSSNKTTWLLMKFHKSNFLVTQSNVYFFTFFAKFTEFLIEYNMFDVFRGILYTFVNGSTKDCKISKYYLLWPYLPMVNTNIFKALTAINFVERTQQSSSK